VPGNIKTGRLIMGGENYNLLTRELLAAGYTIDHHPDYVKVCSSQWGKHPLENLAGGFEYLRWYVDQFVYQTGCGKHVMGNEVLSDMHYMNVFWAHENDNPVIRCPFDNPDCEKNDKRLHGIHGGGLCIQYWCVCHRTCEKYNYENSIEKANELRQQEQERKYKEYSDALNGRICYHHMYYNERTRSWNLRYEPYDCVRKCHSLFCPILNKELDKKKGNIYYDLKKRWIRSDGTLFDGEEVMTIEKGIRFFDKPVSMDICQSFIKLQSNEIYQRYWWNTGSTLQLFDKSFKAEILNIRAESRPGRDLMQDLADINSGIEIFHSSDLLKQKKETKKQNRLKRRQKAIDRLEKKILRTGYSGLEPFSLDKCHADKWLSVERIAELELQRAQLEKERQNQPQQMSLFDFGNLN